jgi:hypothetical protein
MPIDPNIALQVKPLQLNDPLAQYAQVSQIQNAQNQNALAQYQLQSAQRENEYEKGVQNYFATKPDLTSSNAQAELARFGKTGLGYAKIISEQQKNAVERKKLDLDVKKQQQDFEIKATNDLALNPSRENIIAWGQNARIEGRGTPEEVQAKVDQYLAMEPGKLQQYLIQKGASSKELIAAYTSKPVQKTDNQTTWTEEGNSNLPTFGQRIAAAPVIQMKTTPSQDLSAKTAREGHDVTLRGQNLVDAREKQKINLQIENQRRAADPAFQQSMAQARVTGETMAKDKVLRATQLPKVLDTAEMTINEIDAMIGKRDAKGNLVKGAAPHPGFSSTVGATLLPGARFVPGRDEADFQTRFDQVKGGAFLQAFETLKGGGSITNIEGEKGTAALNRMSLAQSEKEFINAAIEFKGIVRKGVERAKKLAGGSDTSAAASGGNADPLGIR